jgi:phospholipase C
MSMGNIKHVVVLMVENRSFDSMLGWLYEKDTPAQVIPQRRTRVTGSGDFSRSVSIHS